MIQIAIQGVAGSYHEQAAREFFPDEQIEVVPCRSFPKLFEALREDESMIGIMAIENTIAGALLQNHELLRESHMQIIGEHKLRIEHMVAALAGSSLTDIEEVNSHPIALMQCQRWLRKVPNAKVVEGDDTASSAKRIATQQLRGHAAICSELAAQLYGLEIIERSVETNKRNFTRFLVLAHESRAKEAAKEAAKGRATERSLPIDKASIVFTLAHSSGALSKVLSILSFYDINLTKIQSMPIIGREWEYQFYVDLTFTSHERYEQAINAIRPLTNYIKSLGEYRSFTTTEE